jgi:hypothetical protein
MTRIFTDLFICCSLLDLLWLINMKLVGNWASCISLSLGFNVMWVWDLCPSLEGLPWFSYFIFFFFFKLMFFKFYHSIFISLTIRLCFFFICILYVFFYNFQNNSSYLRSFHLLFFIGFTLANFLSWYFFFQFHLSILYISTRNQFSFLVPPFKVKVFWYWASWFSLIFFLFIYLDPIV